MKVAALIDGFNLYHHMDNSKFRRYKWLNFSRMFAKFKNLNDILEIHYFTTINYEEMADYELNKETYSRKLKRHLILIEAEKSYGVIPHYGHFKKKYELCKKCKKTYAVSREKQTDVAIASFMVYLAFEKKFERFILLTRDTDLISAIRLVKEKLPKIRFTLLLPPGVRSSGISEYCDETKKLTEEILSDSLFPISFTDKVGKKHICPDEWIY